MKKNTFYTAVLLFAGAVMTACSSGDDITSDVTPESQPSTEAGVVELSGTLGSKGSVTRAIDNWGYGTWKEGDQFAVYYQTANGNATTTATVNSVNGDGSANFTAVLHNPKSGNNSVKLVYPASAHNGSGGFKTDALMNQKGTLDYINANGLDIETAPATMNVEGMKATLKDNVTMVPQVCLYKMKIQDDKSNNLTTKKLEIREGTHTYTITPTTPDYILTMALLPTESADFSITATTTGEINTYTKRDGVTLTNCTAENVGDVFDEGGNVYSASKVPAIYSNNYSGKTLEAGKFYSGIVSLSISSTPPMVGMIAYVGERGTVDDSSTDAQTGFRGLALAMKNISEGNTREYKWCDQSSNYCTNKYSDYIEVARGWKNGITMTDALVNHTSHTDAHTAAVEARNYGVNNSVSRPTETTSDWFLPSLGQWQLILQGLITKGEGNPYSTPIGNYNINGSDFNKGYSSFDSILENAGAEGIYICSWSSSESSSGSAWCLVVNKNECSAFSDGKSEIHTVRPVLAFK